MYWVRAAWVVHMLFMVAYSWWRIWAYHDAAWNLFAFFSVLAATAILYYQAATLVPAQTANVESWRAYFDTVRRPFFGAAIPWPVLIALLGETETNALLDGYNGSGGHCDCEIAANAFMRPRDVPTQR